MTDRTALAKRMRDAYEQPIDWKWAERLRTICLEAADELDRPVARDDVIEECAKVLDEHAQDMNRIRDVGMANHDRSLARKVRALKAASSDAPLTKCPHSDGNSCEQYRLQGQRCQDCPAPRADEWTPREREVIAELMASQELSEHAVLRQGLRIYQMQVQGPVEKPSKVAPRSDAELREILAEEINKTRTPDQTRITAVHFEHPAYVPYLAALKRVQNT